MRDTVPEQQPVSEHGAVSVWSPTQALPPNKGAVQTRTRNFVAHEQEGLQSDHLPHSCHADVDCSDQYGFTPPQKRPKVPSISPR